MPVYLPLARCPSFSPMHSVRRVFRRRPRSSFRRACACKGLISGCHSISSDAQQGTATQLFEHMCVHLLHRVTIVLWCCPCPLRAASISYHKGPRVVLVYLRDLNPAPTLAVRVHHTRSDALMILSPISSHAADQTRLYPTHAPHVLFVWYRKFSYKKQNHSDGPPLATPPGRAEAVEEADEGTGEVEASAPWWAAWCCLEAMTAYARGAAAAAAEACAAPRCSCC